MKIQIVLNKEETQALLGIIKTFIRKNSGRVNIELYSYMTALQELYYKHFSKERVQGLKSKNKICLNDLQTLALFKMFREYETRLGDYEGLLSMTILKTIHEKYSQECRLRDILIEDDNE